VKCCGTLSGQVCYTLTSSVSEESDSVTIVEGGARGVSHTHKRRLYLAGMLKQQTHQQCCFTVNQVLNKPNKENGCNFENFVAHFKCLRSKLVGNVYAIIIFMCWHVRSRVASIAPFGSVWYILSVCSK
jgi:hypothetical protein